MRVGFTASRKVGNAVARNRAKRRLRAAAAAILPKVGRPGTDYVLIARAATASRPFAALVSDLAAGLRRVEPGGRPERSRLAQKE
jgi:ribonuclease P protein component